MTGAAGREEHEVLACGDCLEYVLDEYVDRTGRAPDVEPVEPGSGRIQAAGATVCVRCGAEARYRLV